MKTREAIEKCDSMKPNCFDRETKEAWILELEQKIVSEIWNRSERYKEMEIPTEIGEELLAKEPYAGLYLKWLFLQMDYYNEEMERYNNDALLFNAEYADYTSYFRRNNMPAR